MTLDDLELPQVPIFLDFTRFS